jgi:hypothetical protein
MNYDIAREDEVHELPSLRDWLGLGAAPRPNGPASGQRVASPAGGRGPTMAPAPRQATTPARVLPAPAALAPTPPIRTASAPGALARPARPVGPPGVSAPPAAFAQLPASGPGFYTYARADRRFGQPATIRAIQAIGAAWQRANPNGPRIGIGDISFQGGGPMPPHRSHQTGIDVDVRPFRADGIEGPVRLDLPGYSRALTQQLVDVIRSSGAPVQFILFNDPVVRGVRAAPGHDNHLHIRFAAGPVVTAAAAPAVSTVAMPSRQPTPATAMPTGRPMPTMPAPRQATISTVAPATARLGTLVAALPTGGQFRYSFTPEDLLWTARFVVAEAGGRDDPQNRAVIWAMFNRYALLTHSRYPTFHQFIRAYSAALQPVLRSWRAARRHMNDPDYARTGRDYPTTGRNPAPPGIPVGQLRRFLRLQETPFEQLPVGARALATAALTGQVANPVGVASEFANMRVFFRDRYGRKPTDEEWNRFTVDFARKRRLVWIGQRKGLDQRGNAFLVQQRLAALPADTVRVEPPSVR